MIRLAVLLVAVALVPTAASVTVSPDAPLAKTAGQQGLPRRDPLSAALALAKASYRQAYRQASLAGCLRGFRLQGVL